MWDVAKVVTATIFNVKRPEIKGFGICLKKSEKEQWNKAWKSKRDQSWFCRIEYQKNIVEIDKCILNLLWKADKVENPSWFFFKDLFVCLFVY